MFFLGTHGAPCSLAFSLQHSTSEKGHRHLYPSGLTFQLLYCSMLLNFSGSASLSVNVGFTAALSPVEELQDAGELIHVKRCARCAVTTVEAPPSTLSVCPIETRVVRSVLCKVPLDGDSFMSAYTEQLQHCAFSSRSLAQSLQVRQSPAHLMVQHASTR